MLCLVRAVAVPSSTRGHHDVFLRKKSEILEHHQATHYDACDTTDLSLNREFVLFLAIEKQVPKLPRGETRQILSTVRVRTINHLTTSSIRHSKHQSK